jgi:hypothetical protein
MLSHILALLEISTKRFEIDRASVAVPEPRHFLLLQTEALQCAFSSYKPTDSEVVAAGSYGTASIFLPRA